MSAEDIRAFLRSTAGQVFTIWFVKRTTGELRKMNCRTEVKKHLAHPENPPDPKHAESDKEHDLLRVFDMKKGGYRMINLRSVTKIRCGGQEFVNDE